MPLKVKNTETVQLSRDRHFVATVAMRAVM